MESDNSFKMDIKSLVGNDCSSLIAGIDTGSVINLGFGKLIRRLRPLKNPTLTDTERMFKSSIEIMIYSAWRVIECGQISFSWRDATEEDSHVFLKLKRLIDDKVTDIELDDISKDLQITFESGTVFQIFCDITNDNESEDNYVCFTGNDTYSVSINGQLTKE